MKEKLLEKLDGRPLSHFWKNNIKENCGITYPTFVSQLHGTTNMRSDVKKIVQDFNSAK